MAVALVGSVGNATEVTSGTTITGTYGQSPTAGNLLVAVISRVGTTATASPTSTGATGWTRLLPTSFVTNIGVGSATACTNLVDFWYKAAAGGDAQPVFTMTNAGGTTFRASCTIYELSGANTSAPLDVSGTQSSGGTSATITTVTTTTSANVTAAGEFAISAGTRERTAGAPTITYSASWTNGFNDGATSEAGHIGVAHLAGPSSGATASDVTSFSGTGTSAFSCGAIVVISVAPTTTANAGLATGTGAAQNATVTIVEDSPALELSGFGTFPAIASGDTINSVTVSIAQFSSTTALGPPTFQLWDGGTAQIGATCTGNGRTGTENVDTATFTGVSYSQLATLRVRVYGHNGSAPSGATLSVDAAWLTVDYTPAPSAPAGPATGTGTALSPAVQVTALAGLATGTGAALQIPALAGLATGTGTALSPAVQVTGFQLIVVQSELTAFPAPQQITPQVFGRVVSAQGLANAGLATGTGTALSPVVQVTALAGLATGTGAALTLVPQVTAFAGLATGTGAALQPSVSTTGSTTANAGLATGTGTALSPVAQVTALAGLATGTGAALSPAAQVTAFAGLATGTGAALAPVPQVTALAGLATGTGAALSPAAQVTAFAGLASAVGAALQIPAHAGPATGAGTALAPVPQVTANAGLATGTGAALPPVAQVTAFAGLASAVGAALQPLGKDVTGGLILVLPPGLRTVKGTQVLPLPSPALSFTGVMGWHGPASIALPALRTAITGRIATEHAQGAPVLPVPAFSLAGIAQKNVTAPLALVLPALRAPEAGVLAHTGNFALDFSAGMGMIAPSHRYWLGHQGPISLQLPPPGIWFPGPVHADPAVSAAISAFTVRAEVAMLSLDCHVEVMHASAQGIGG